VLNEGRRTEMFEPVRVPTTARALVEATNALLPYSLSPQELGDLAGVRRRVVAIADLLVGGLRSPRGDRGRSTAVTSSPARTSA
jgi:hypothetical protein